MYYKRILNALPELIYVTKGDGITAIFYNKTWYAYTGLTEKDVDAGWGSIVSPYDLARVRAIIHNAVQNKEPYELEVRLKCGETGKYRWFLSKANPVFDADGNLDSYVGISRDITEAKLSLRDMEKVYEAEMEKRLKKIKELEQQLEIHTTENDKVAESG